MVENSYVTHMRAFPPTRSTAFLLALAALLLGFTLAAPAAEAARCFGERAKVLNQAKTYNLDRYDAVFINAPARINAPGDNKICSAKHGARITLGKANSNKLALGSGDDTVIVAAKSSLAHINAGGGNNTVILNAKASKQVVITGSGNDRVVVNKPAKTANRSITTGLGNDSVIIKAKGNTT